jgi:hypothetical protein
MSRMKVRKDELVGAGTGPGPIMDEGKDYL